MNNFKVIFDFLNKYGGNIVIANKNNSNYNEQKHSQLITLKATSFDNEWKSIVEHIMNKIKVKKILSTQQWQNSGNIFDYFWTQFKSEDRLDSASSISVFARKSSIEVKLTWHFAYGKKSQNSLKQHNMWVARLENWVNGKSIDTSKYTIWYGGDGNEGNKSTLEKYFNSNDEKDLVLNGSDSSGKTFLIEIGKEFNKEYVVANGDKVLTEIINTTDEIEELYKATSKRIDIISTNNNESHGLGISKNYYESRLKIDEIRRYVISKSFIYHYNDLANFYLSLKTKPFIILAGISGTGKSKLVKLFANAVGATSDNGQYNIISVKPDWNDSTELFGYKNINDEFVPGKLTEIIFRASKEENINKPYFICLDEMNLARVEYYLSEYLSIIESREFDVDNNIKTDRLFPAEYLPEGNKYANLRIPENIYIVGTVNMDDTTFAFSRKVLDRANTIEFSDVDLDALDFNNEECESIDVDNNFFKTSFLNIKDALNTDDAFVRQTNSKVKDINEILEQGNKNFGYRVRDEIVFYMLENKINDLLSEDEAFDFQIMQKILPIITGSELLVKEILIKLFNYCNTNGKEVTATIEYIKEREVELKSGKIKYKKSAKKILMMLRGYEDGFTSFWA